MDDVWHSSGDSFVGRPVSFQFSQAQPIVRARPVSSRPAQPGPTTVTAIRINPDGSAVFVQFATSDRAIGGLALLGFLVIAGVFVYASFR